MHTELHSPIRPINLFYQPRSACAYSHFQETGLNISKVLVSTGVSKQPGTMQRSFTEGKDLFFFLTFYFVLGDSQLTSKLIVLREQRRESAIHIHMSILPQSPLPSRLPHTIEQSSLCSTVGPSWLSILNRAVCPSPTP